MIRRKGQYHSNTSFLDLLFNTLVGFVMLFIIAFLLISPIKKKKDIEQKAEYVITVSWPNEYSDDVDTWLEDPAEKLMSFRNKEIGLMHLDRDDLGHLNDNQNVPGVGNVNYPYNREITTIRGIMPGEYVLNIHMYRKEGKEPVPVTVVLEKLNPTVKLIYSTTEILSVKWEEKTIIRFTLNVDGEILDTRFIYKPLVKKSISSSYNENNMSNNQSGTHPGEVTNIAQPPPAGTDQQTLIPPASGEPESETINIAKPPRTQIGAPGQ